MKRFICLLLAIMIMCVACVSALADEMPDCKVSLTASHTAAQVGDTVKVSLMFENAADYPYGLAAFCAILTYDKNVLKLDSIVSAAPRTSVTSNSKPGELKTLYIFASAAKEPGFNTNSVFYTATFTVLDSTADNADLNVTFDAITVSDYSNDKKVTNYQVPFNSPSVSVDIVGNEPIQSENVSSAATSNASSDMSSKTTSDIVASVGMVESKPTSVINDNFVDVEQNSSSDKVSVDKFDNDGNLIEETEKDVEPTVSTIQPSDQPESANPLPKGNDKLFIAVMSILAATVIGAITAIIILIVRKNKH